MLIRIKTKGIPNKSAIIVENCGILEYNLI
jgi:hypothetical protein